MKKKRILGLLAITAAFGFVACNNDGNSTASTDSTSTVDANDNATATTTTSSGSYAAQADSFRTNSEAGNYLDARTGKPIRISVDPQTGVRTNVETGEPVWRYIDRRTWWVYGNDSWDTVGSARMENDQIRYRGENDSWVTYDERWKTEDEKKSKEWKMKSGDVKIKVDEDGDAKIKTDAGKVKRDADDGEVKVKKDN